MDLSKIKQWITPAFWGAVAGAAILAIVGFNWGGWVSGATARAMAQTAVVERLVPICVGQFNADTNKAMKLVELKKIDSWKQADFVVKQGWATMPGTAEPNNSVADGCATQLAG